MKRKNKKIMQAAGVIIIVLAFVMPGSAMIAYDDTVAVNTLDDTKIKVTCTIGGEKATRWIPTETLKSVVEIGKSCKEGFLTIFNKWAPEDEVEGAFDEVSIFFDALINNSLTDKTSEELEDLFWNIRGRIRKPRRDPSDLIHVNPDDPQPLGNWNGIPTPIFGNIACGLFNAGFGLGFTLGTHTLIPTIGADLFTTWADTGETITLGTLGFTTSTGPEFGIIAGFIGVMIATPIMMLGPFFQVGFAGIYLGVGPAPF